MAKKNLTPDHILQLGLGFWSSKTTLSAVELGLFTLLAKKPQNTRQITATLGLHARSARDFLDALVSLGLLDRKGETYSNTPESTLFLDRNKPSYCGGMLEMANARLYGFWGSLTEALRTGEPQNEAKTGRDLFDELYKDPARLEGFLKAMTGVSAGAAMQLAKKFPWKKYKSFIDVGCAQGAVPVFVAQAHKHLAGGGFDLPMVGPIFERFVAHHGLSERVTFRAGSFLDGDIPSADVLVMGHILHDWDLPTKMMLLRKAYKALPNGGALIVYEALIDDARRKNAFGLLMSLNMLIETRGGFDYTGADCRGWMKEAGFRQSRVQHLLGPDSMVVGIK